MIVLVPNVIPDLQRGLFEAAIQYLGGRELVNRVLEATLEAQTVTVHEYELPST